MSEQVNVRVIEAQLSTIRPGDKVLIRVPGDMTCDQFDAMRAALKERMLDVDFCVISGVEGTDVYRPDPPGEGGPG